jgi:hypothetical protein
MRPAQPPISFAKRRAGKADDTHSSGIRLKFGRSADALGDLDVHVPPLDPLPRMPRGRMPRAAAKRERLFVATPDTVTAERGRLISIAPTAASIQVLSSRPPRPVPENRRRAGQLFTAIFATFGVSLALTALGVLWFFLR